MPSVNATAQVTRWNVVTSLDIFSELAIMVTPSYLVSSVLMKRKPKLLVGFAFGFRIMSVAQITIKGFIADGLLLDQLHSPSCTWTVCTLLPVQTLGS